MCSIFWLQPFRKIIYLVVIITILTFRKSETLANNKGVENVKFKGSNIRNSVLVTPNETNLNRYYSALASGLLFRNAEDILYNCESLTYADNITGNSIRVGAILGLEHNINHTVQNGTLQFTGGLYSELLRYLTDSFNLTVIAINGMEYAATSPKMPKNRSDIGNMIINDEIDLAVSAHEFTDYRITRFTYLQPIYKEKLWGYFIQPPASSIRDIYLQPFQSEIWIAMAFTWITTIFSVILLVCSKEYFSVPQYKDKMIFEVIMWATGCICQHGGHLHPESVSLKIVFFCGLASGLVTYLGYCAALVSVLSLDVIPLKVLDDLASAKFQFYGSDAIPNVLYYMKKIQEDDPGLVSQRSLTTPSVGINEVLRGGSVFLTYDDEFFPTIKANRGLPDSFICSTISKIIVNNTPVKASMLVKKGSPYAEIFNRKVIWMINNGIFRRLRKHHAKLTKTYCLRNSYHSNDALGINDIFTAIVILLSISSLSLLFFVFEKILRPRPTLIQNIMALEYA